MVSTNAAPEASVIATVREYWMNVFYNLPIKATLAGALTWFVQSTGLSLTVLWWYALITVLEFAVTTCEKITYHQWKKSHLSHWVYRVSTQLTLAALVGGLFHMIGETTGSTYAGINWVLILCSTVDFGSIVESLVKIGAPVPPFMAVVSRAFKRWSAVYLGNMLSDPKARKELEKALGVTEEKVDDGCIDGIAPDIHGARG